MARYIDSSSRTYDEYERQRIESQSDAILDIGVGIGSIYGASKFIESDVGQNISKRLFKLNTVNTYFADRNSTYTDWKIKNRITLGDIVLDTSKVLEEISPLKILRTFHVSSFISPYTIPKANLAEISITKDQMLIDEIYIRSLIKKVNPNASASLINELFNEGAIFREGKLLTQKGDEVLANARLVKLNPSPEASLGSAEHPFINRVYQKFRNVIGDRDDSGFYKNIKSPKGGYGIIAGKSEASMALDWARAYGRLAIEPGFKLFDRPMDVLAEIVDKTELDKRINIPHNLREKLYLGAGAGGDYTQSVPGMFKSMVKNITRLTIGGALAYNVANEALELLPEDSPYSKGVTEGLATTYVSARLGIAELWSDNFQDYKTKQEELAPGSTSLATLVGFPLAGALLGANIGYFQRVADATVNNVAAADTRALRESTSNIVNNLSGQKINPKLNRVGKYSAIGAMLATIPIIPFLPGALIGESSENLEAIYSGEEDVAIRSTRFWGSGGGPMEGGKIKYYTKSWYRQLMNNSETAGIYGDDDTRDELNPVLNPFDYLRNPYRLEERNQDKSPYAVWGMEVSYGGAFGKLFQGTVGALIKPDVVNKRLEDYADKESDGTFTIKTQVSESEASLVEEGLMLAPESASLNVEKELLHTSYSALTDFAGLKGWITSLASEAVHSGVGDPGLQLDRSGAMLNSARSIQESNLGGMGPLGESLRRFIPTNSGSILDRANPLRNQTPEWLPHDVSNYWIDFSTGDPFCVSANTLIEISSGKMVYADKILCGDIITTHTGKNMPVKNIIKRQVLSNEQVFKFKIATLTGVCYEISEEHPILVLDNNEYVWKKAKDIVVGDYVSYPMPNYNNIDNIIIDTSLYLNKYAFTENYIYVLGDNEFAKCYEIAESIQNKKFKRGELNELLLSNNISRKKFEAAQNSYKNKKVRRVSRFIELNAEIAYLMGIYCAEGWTNYSMIGTVHNINESSYAEKAFVGAKCIDEKSTQTIHTSETYLTSHIFSSCVQYFIEQYVGNLSTNKFIAEEIFNSKKDIQKSFIKGYFDGDGSLYVSKGKYFASLKTVNLQLAIQFRKLLLGHGFVFSIIKQESKTGYQEILGKTRRQLDSYSVILRGKEAIRFAEYFGYILSGKIYDDIKYKNTYYKIENNYVSMKVLDISAIDNIDIVYGFEVDIDDSFCVAGIATHNTKVEKGYFRLPGEGYALQNKELEGVDPNDYPFIHRYKILSDVAMGSDEYYHYKDIIEARASNNQLTDYELDLFNKINYQTSKRSVKKEFYSNENDGLVSRYWKSITSASELPTESLTFLRPSAKLIHKRTALEDYYATQVDGTDTGMWTKPYEHFIKPAINKSLQSEEMPEETQDKRAVNEYFDKLEYIKQRRLYKKSIEDGDGQSYLYKNKYQKTLTGALASGLDENMEITRAYIALPDQEKAYFAEFSSATSESDRENIIKAESAPIAELYSKIWKRRDAIVENYQDPTSQAEAINSIVEKESSELARSNPLMYAQYRSSKDQEHSSFAEFVADKEAEAYISKTTGMPSEGFAGWDPRIDIKDIKLRTLMIGKEDVRSFGFWEGDEERLKRLVVLNDENQVSGQIDEIKAGIREEKSRIAMIKNDLYKRGISVDSVDFFTSKTDDINLQIGA